MKAFIRKFCFVFLFALFVSGAMNALASREDAMAGQYVFQLWGSPAYARNKGNLFPAYDELVFDLKKGLLFNGTSTYSVISCRKNKEMMCFDASSRGFLLYLPRDKRRWKKWTHSGMVYIFEGWKKYPFVPREGEIGAVHVFQAKEFDENNEMIYPTETFFIDKKIKLVGMVGYDLKNPGYVGLHDNNISTFYWIKGDGLPLSEF